MSIFRALALFAAATLALPSVIYDIDLTRESGRAEADYDVSAEASESFALVSSHVNSRRAPYVMNVRTDEASTL